MNIKETRELLQMSQRQFASHFGIPLGTIRNWEQGIANPPEYVSTMILTSIRRDKMINIETIKFVLMLNELAELTKNGIKPFSEATLENIGEYIFYSEKCDINNDELYPIVLDLLIDDNHHDAISFYGMDTNEYSIGVVIDDEAPYINVKFAISEEEIVIEDGRWYFV